MQRALLFALYLSAAGFLAAFEAGAYVPHYRIEFASGAETRLARPSWDPSPHPWDGRIEADRLPLSLPSHWSEGSWSRRLGAAFGSLYLHIPLDGDFPEGGLPDPRQISFLESVVGDPDVRIFLSVLGGSSEFMPLAADDAPRKEFVDAVVELCEASGLDGFDLDWEFSSAPKAAEVEAAGSLAADLRAGLPEEVALSAAVSRWRLPGEGFFDAVDEIHLMSYDGGGRHATYESAVADAETVLARLETEPGRLFLGLPFYGRDSRADSPGYWIDAKSYSDIKGEFDPPPSSDEAGGYAFNGPMTIRRKSDWARDKELGGVFVWEPFQDSPGKGSLISAVRDAVMDDSDGTPAAGQQASPSGGSPDE